MLFLSKLFQKGLLAKAQILWVIAAGLSIYFLYYSFKNAGQPSHGFATYYTASNLLIKGEDVADFYDDDWFSSRVEEYVPGIYEIYLVNLPTTALIFLPVAKFDYKTAKIIWTIFNILLLTIVFGLILNKMKLAGVWLPLALIISLAFQPLYANITYGQIYILIFSFLVLAWFEYESGNDFLLGISIGLVLILKTAGVFLLILLAIKKKWKSLIWVFVTVVFLFAATLPIFGVNAWFAYFDKLSEYASSPTLSVTAYQTIHSIFHHLFVYDTRWNPDPVMNLPLLGRVLTIFFSAMILVITTIITFRNKKSDLVFGAFVIVGIILSPPSIDYHYLLMLIPIFILFNWLIKNPSVHSWILFVISYLLIASSLPYISPKITGGILALFAYPKLYGALGMLSLLLRAGYITKHPES